MDENKQTDIDTTSTPVNMDAMNLNQKDMPTEGGGSINFDQLLIGGEKTESGPELTASSELVVAPEVGVSDAPDLSTPTVEAGEVKTETPETTTTDPISQVNALLQEEIEQPKIDISNIEIEELNNNDGKEKSKIFEKIGTGGKDILLKIHNFNYRKIISISAFVATFCVIVSGIVWARGKYIDVANQPQIDTAYESYVNNIKTYKSTVSEYTSINDYYKLYNTSFVDNNAKSNVDMILNSNRLSYTSKKDIFQNSIDGLVNNIKSNNSSLENIKQDLTRYGFFPKDLLTIFGENEENISIKKSLMSLEVVKFSTAIKIFSYLDTFIKGLANIIDIDPASVQKQMQDLDKRGEKDILIYLNNCYLNPFELGSDCDLVGDFDRYYTYNEKDKSFSLSFFKKLMSYIDLKLEQSDLPSFSIVFQRFDPKQKQISFNVEVNTFQQDETSLISQGIVNPHIFVVTQLINLLKQSLFVIGENIDAKKVSIQPKVISIGSTTFSVNSSSMSFNLPIQKNTQREISDFILNSNYFESPISVGVEDVVPGYDGLVSSGGVENVVDEQEEDNNVVVSTGEVISSTSEVEATPSVIGVIE